LKLGKIQQVDLREVWPNEATSFTPWLEQNPEELGELLGLDLEFVREKPVGKFSLDLFGIDLITGRQVIVENQLETSNHGHLGQLLTYAGGVAPSILIWVAKSIRAEHRAALEWLNSVTGAETLFFGIEVKAVRIGNSDPAPMLDIVVEPNSWAKEIKSSGNGVVESEKSRTYSAFWRDFIDEATSELPEFAGRTAWGRQWFPTGAGISGLNLNLVFTSQGLRVELYFGHTDPEINKSRFDKAFSRRAQIEQLAGEIFEWETLDGKKACRISFYGPKGDVSNKDEWAGYIEWFVYAYSTLKKINGALVVPALRS
jgi:hypothetical protein